MTLFLISVLTLIGFAIFGAVTLAKTTCSLALGANTFGGNVEMSFGGITWATEDTTPFDANTYTTLVSTVKTNQPITIKLTYNASDAAHAALLAAAQSGALTTFTFVAGALGTATAFGAYVTNFQPVTGTKNLLAVQATITPAGVMTFA